MKIEILRNVMKTSKNGQLNFVVKFLTVLSRFYLKEDGYSTGEHGDEVDEQKSSWNITKK